MTDYGADVSTYPDLDVSGLWLTGGRVVAEACVRRLETPTGLLSWEPSAGYDLRAWMHRGYQARELALLGARVAQECEADERVLRANVDVMPLGEGLRISVELVLSDASSFAFTLAIDSVNFNVLFGQQ